MKNKRGQTAIFIILGIVLIAVVLFIFRNNILGAIYSPKDPSSSIQQCVEDAVERSLKVIELQGGVVYPELYYSYEGNKLTYLCYTPNYAERCVMQKPLVIKMISKEIENYIRPSVEDCLSSVKERQIEKGYSVSMSNNPNISVKLVPGKIEVDVDSELTVSDGESTQSYKSIKTQINSKIYELAMITTSILNWEAFYGEAISMNYMFNYPSIKVEQYKQGDGTIVYIISDRMTNEKFMFASRSLVIPSGMTGQ